MPFELNRDMFNENSKAVKLYVKRVFINDKFEELMPRWLTFVRGVVDSEDLPLNVGREILQKSKMLSVINKRLVRKSIDMFKTIQARVSLFVCLFVWLVVCVQRTNGDLVGWLAGWDEIDSESTREDGREASERLSE